MPNPSPFRHLTRAVAAIAALLLPSAATHVATAAEDAERLPEDAKLELYLLVGQSNMAGRGEVEPADREGHPRVWTLTKDREWVIARDPIHFDKPIAGVGLGTTFGKTIAEHRPEAHIGLIPTAVGGSAISEWAKGEKHYENAVSRTREAMERGELKAILWHQGEADGRAERREAYPQRLSELVANLRADLDAPDVPFLVGELVDATEGKRAFNAMLPRAVASIDRCALVSSKGLKDNGDNTHFDAASLREFGRRYAKAYLELVEEMEPGVE